MKPKTPDSREAAKTMGRWKFKQIAKKGRAARETGKKKGLVPPAWAKWCCRNNRSYKNAALYSKWNELCDGNKIKWNKAA